ncbi:MAG: CHC2 zinc finger domain-containing protein [Novosphingobium sp.]|nr:CHC2 zinc finger domain-containing protein [Novosphingobium sp.]
MFTIDVRQILDHYNISYTEKKNSDELYILCPFHNDHNFGSALFNETTTEWNCFSCKVGGNAYKFVMLLENCEFKDAKKLIESNFNDNTYDLKRLESQFQRAEKRLQNTSKDSKTSVVIVHKFLDAFIYRKYSPQFYNKWYKVCVYLMHNKQDDKQNLQFYTSFFSELNNQENLT